MNIDLDVARAARAEVRGDTHHTITLGGKVFELPAELPVDVGMFLSEGKWRDALQVLLDDSVEAFFAQRPSDEDLSVLWAKIGVAYGLGDDEGESNASAPSSSKGGRSSRQISKRTTASTSAKPAGVKRQSA